MNEQRIREIAKQCSDFAEQIPYFRGIKDGLTWEATIMKARDLKFAELIVQECLKEIKDMIVDESEQLYPNNKQTTECVNDRLMDAYDNIKELFRVES